MANGRVGRRRTISLAKRAPRGSSPKSRKILGERFFTLRVEHVRRVGDFAVAAPPMRMSRRTPGRKVKPRSAASIWCDEMPRSSQDAVERDAVERRNVGEIGVVGLHGREAAGRGKRREPVAGGGQRLRVAIDADDTRGPSLEQREAVAAAAEGTIEHAARVPQELDDLVGEHRRVICAIE